MTTQSALARTTSSHVGTDLSRDRAQAERLETALSLIAVKTAAAIVGREIVASSERLDQQVEAVVCIPAFRRPTQLRATLHSLERQVTSVRFAVVVAENDAEGRASIVEAHHFLMLSGIPGLCVLEPRQGNCRAINAAFETARAAFPQADAFLMIDDDEIASPDWLERMVEASRTSGADIVGGPVYPRFSDGRDHLAQHPVFCPAYAVTGPVPTIYGSGNCLIRRSVFESLAPPSFDLRFNFLGGGDTDFFGRGRAAGLRFYWVAEATVVETVPPERTRLSWIAGRGVRIGAINYLSQRGLQRTPAARFRFACKMAVLWPYSLVRAGRMVRQGGSWLMAVHPVLVASGSLLALIGIRPQPYRARI
ncbi:glycosyltransferase family 2 protein [Bradyrhizobium sp. WD16]|uniref:glycosyltransferase family 2 protein n=1 Tax=Bradyrhizobium sp. WD16 TaxID=1521768 RepID=UPI0020A3082C|nr:glycosyltransferase family 2 protein [Bradyrhizobium sp. WD16]UTD29870.1 glycosyl transferase family A [Bradyrhizobium sp. WD16]